MSKAAAEILDVCCGSKMFYFNKEDHRVVFSDIRRESHTLCDGRELIVDPDHIGDFRFLQYADNRFSIVVFDPPHIKRAGPNSWQAKKYGKLSPQWKDDLTQGFSECFRVLKIGGVLIFKWNEVQIPISEILSLTNQRPLLGNRTGRQSKSHWVVFVKG